MDPCCQHLPPRPIPNEFQCEEKIIVDDSDDDNGNDDEDAGADVFVVLGEDEEDDESEDCDGYTYQFSCTVPYRRQQQQQQLQEQQEHYESSKQQQQRKYLTFQCRGRSVGVMSEPDTHNNNKINNEIVGVGVDDEGKTGHGDDDEHDDDGEQPMLDPFFFDEGYTLAGRTGFQVWAGSRLMLESLLYPFNPSQQQQQQQQQRLLSQSSASESPSPPSTTPGQDIVDTPRLQYWQRRILEKQSSSSPSQSQERQIDDDEDRHRHRALKILELGSGVGLVGSSLAALGHQVVLTDLPTLVKHSVLPNMKLNSFRKKSNKNIKDRPFAAEDPPLPPLWLSSIISGGRDAQKNCARGYHICPIQAGNDQDFGWMRELSLDWTKPLQVQVPNADQSLQGLDLVVASDCVWLKSMLDSLLDTVASIFDVSGPQTSFILSFQRRDKNGRNRNIPNQTPDRSSKPPDSSSMFTTVESILEAIDQRGWTWECLAWRYTMVEAEEHEKEECNGGDMLRREVYVVEVRPSS